MKHDQHNIDNEVTMACEPLAAYGAAAIGRRTAQKHLDFDDELDDFWSSLSDEQLRAMPGVYTDEEFEEEVRKSEASGTMSHDEVVKMFEGCGYYR